MRSYPYPSGLFDRSRQQDPETSRIAAAAAAAASACQREACRRMVEQVPGLTAAEIAERLGIERHVPSRRLPELRAAGLVANDGQRVCRVTGHMSLTWSRPAFAPLLGNGAD